MTTAVQRRRGTNTEHASFTGLEGEISVNTTNESVHVHDGSTAGGFELMRADGANSTVSLGDITGVTAGTGLSGGGTTGTVTLDIDGTVATLAGTQTFTNKTLTSPILNTPTIGTSFTIGGATITEAELEILDGATVTTTELNYVDGVTSSIQTQIDAKAPLASPSFTGNISVTGTVDGRDVSVDGAKLDLINQGVATTDSPTFDDGTFTGILSITPTSGYGHIEVGGVDGAFIDLKSPSSDDYDLRMITTGGNGGTIDVGSTGDLSFNAGGSERARLLSTGQVGIGTSSPSTYGGKLNITDGAVGGESTLVIANNNANQFVRVGINNNTAQIAYDNADSLAFGEATDSTTAGLTTERMRIDSSGNVGIGITSPSAKLDVDGQGCFKKNYSFASTNYHIKLKSAYGNGISSYIGNVSSSDRMNISAGGYYYGASLYQLTDGATGMGAINIGEDGTLTYQSTTGATANSTVNPAERMRIDSSGNLLVGLTTTSVTSGGFAFLTGSVDFQMIGHASGVGTGNYYIGFAYNGSTIGAIVQNGTTGIAYNTSSDQRLKENIADADDAGSKIDSIQVRQYDWKADGSHQDYGVVAQELVEVAPEAVTVPADSEEMMGVDYSKLVPMLIKEIQSLRNRVAQLEA